LKKLGFINKKGYILQDPDKKHFGFVKSKKLVNKYENDRKTLMSIIENNERMRVQIDHIYSCTSLNVNQKDLDKSTRITHVHSQAQKKLPSIGKDNLYSKENEKQNYLFAKKNKLTPLSKDNYIKILTKYESKIGNSAILEENSIIEDNEKKKNEDIKVIIPKEQIIEKTNDNEHKTIEKSINQEEISVENEGMKDKTNDIQTLPVERVETKNETIIERTEEKKITIKDRSEEKKTTVKERSEEKKTTFKTQSRTELKKVTQKDGEIQRTGVKTNTSKELKRIDENKLSNVETLKRSGTTTTKPEPRKSVNTININPIIENVAADNNVVIENEHEENIEE
jgi:hypothetical protein